MDESLKADVMYWAAFYERRMRVGNKKIFHLEAWVIKVMCLYKVLCTSFYWFMPTLPWSLGSEGGRHLLIWRFADNPHTLSWQHYFFGVDLDDPAFD